MQKIMGSSTGHVKPKDYKIDIGCSSAKHASFTLFVFEGWHFTHVGYFCITITSLRGEDLAHNTSKLNLETFFRIPVLSQEIELSYVLEYLFCLRNILVSVILVYHDNCFL